MATTYPHYEVFADRYTGEWIGQPKHTGEVDVSYWNAKQDTDDEHYDTYEAEIEDETGVVSLNTETRAVTITWVTRYSIEKYENGDWIWAADGDTKEGCWGDLPGDVLQFADAGKEGEIEVGGVMYRVSHRE